MITTMNNSSQLHDETSTLPKMGGTSRASPHADSTETGQGFPDHTSALGNALVHANPACTDSHWPVFCRVVIQPEIGAGRWVWLTVLFICYGGVAVGASENTDHETSYSSYLRGSDKVWRESLLGATFKNAHALGARETRQRSVRFQPKFEIEVQRVKRIHKAHR